MGPLLLKTGYLEFAEDMYRVPKGVKEVMAEIQQGCGDYTQDVEKQGQDEDNRIDNVVKDSQGVGQVVHCEADRFMTACDA